MFLYAKLRKTKLVNFSKYFLGFISEREERMHAIELLNEKDIWNLAQHCLIENPKILEVGVTRDHGSTQILAHLAKSTSSELILCDLESERLHAVTHDLRNQGISVSSAACQCENLDHDLIKDCGVIHLDGFDAYTLHIKLAKYLRPSKYRAMIAAYQNAGIDFVVEGAIKCAKSHFTVGKRVALERTPYRPQLILIDDTWLSKGIWRGKGATLVPFLLSNGYFLLNEGASSKSLLRKYRWGVGLLI